MKHLKAILSVCIALTLLALCFVPAFAEEPCAHSWQQTEYVAPQGCRDGYVRETCSLCGETAERTLAAAQDHQWEWVVDLAPTRYEVGRQHEACAECGAVRNMNTAIPSVKGGTDFGRLLLKMTDAIGGAIHDFIMKIVDFFSALAK